jgi:hypothetical protein
MNTRFFSIIALFILVTGACRLTSGAENTPVVIPTAFTPPTQIGSPTAAPVPATQLSPTLMLSPEPETPTSISPPPPTGQTDPRGEEAILILQPGPGSRLVSPARVAGVSDSTFEQNLVIRVVLDDGTILNTVPTTIQTELGQRGPFEVEVPFQVSEERQGFIQVFDSSARDGGLLHLASVGVLLAPGGEANIATIEPHPEQIEIFQPAQGEVVSGGSAMVEGFALASFEQTLMVQVLDVDGNIVGEGPVIVSAPDLGQPGSFSVEVPYTVSSAGPGRILVRDLSPAFGGEVHAASVEIQLEP